MHPQTATDMLNAAQPVPSLGAAVPIPPSADPDRCEVTLPSGAKASILIKAKGKHVMLAHRMSNNEGGVRFIFAMIAVKAIIDGRALTIEQIEEEVCDLDVLELMAIVQGKTPGKAAAAGEASSPPGT